MRNESGKGSRGLALAAAWVALLCLAFLAPGCAGLEQPDRRPAETPDWSEQTAESLLDWLRSNRAALGTVSAYFSLSLASPPPGQPSSLQGLLFLRFRAGAPQARIQVLRPFGGVALDMLMDGRQLAVYVPSKKTIYRGETGQLADSGQGPGGFFRFGLAGPDALQAEGAELSVRQESVVVRLEGGRLELDKRTGRIKVWSSGDRQALYSKYVRIGESAWLPGRIRLRSASGERLAECRLEDIQPLPDPDGVFDLSEYSPERASDLRELLEPQR